MIKSESIVLLGFCVTPAQVETHTWRCQQTRYKEITKRWNKLHRKLYCKIYSAVVYCFGQV